MGELFAAIEGKLADIQDAIHRQCERLFTQLEPRLAAAQEIDRELNHHLAHRFNVFRYLRDDELGLSRIIADLLDPRAAHGQGPLFLRLLLDRLNVKWRVSDTDLSKAKVVLERTIKDHRRIDIYVDISSGGKRYCVAIENKPYAGDQYEQVKDYLEHLKERSDLSEFRLIYLSPTGEPPSKKSLPEAEFENWHDRLLIMPYHHWHNHEEGAHPGVDSEGKRDEFREFRALCSLTQWLANCRARCEPQRLRWFLGDAESYCRRTFGDTDMASDIETKTALEFLESHTDHLETARVIHESWLIARDKICEEFLNRLCDCVEAEIKKRLGESGTNLCVEKYHHGRTKITRLKIYRLSWPVHPSKGSTTFVDLCPGRGYSAWYGVLSPPNPTLESKLRAKFPDFKPPDGHLIWQFVAGDWSDWYRIAAKLHQECREEDREITDYYVETLVEFARRAIPIIDKVEGS